MALSQRRRESRQRHKRSESFGAPRTREGAALCTVHLPLKITSLNISKALLAQIHSLNLLQKLQNTKVVYTNKQWCLAPWRVRYETPLGGVTVSWLQLNKNASLNTKQYLLFFFFQALSPRSSKTAGYFRSFLYGVISYYSWPPPSLHMHMCVFFSCLCWPPAHPIFLSLSFFLSSYLFDSTFWNPLPTLCCLTALSRAAAELRLWTLLCSNQKGALKTP